MVLKGETRGSRGLRKLLLRVDQGWVPWMEPGPGKAEDLLRAHLLWAAPMLTCPAQLDLGSAPRNFIAAAALPPGISGRFACAPVV